LHTFHQELAIEAPEEVADIGIDLPRPRRLEALDDAVVSDAARAIRAFLQEDAA